ncbi:MAG: orotate phosphoribosyltransferase [Candidatus Promineifilaceae bacterium]|jgi:orotate phosphoribosyltransferase
MSDNSLTPLESLAVTLYDIGAVQFGKFKLHSGKKSRVYLDMRVLASFPEALREVAGAYRTVLEWLEYDVIAATPLAGLPIGTAIALDMNQPLIYPRKTAKSYGTGKAIEGVYTVGDTAIVIDDLVTSGDSIVQTIAALKAGGLRVTDAVVLIDREQGGAEALREEGYRLHSIMSLPYLLNVLLEQEQIGEKKYNKTLKSISS